MHVLICPSELYLPTWRHTSGIFQRHAAEALTQEGHQVGVLSLGFITLPNLQTALCASVRGDLGVNTPKGAEIVRAWIPLPLPYRWLPPRAYCGLIALTAKRAFKRYVVAHGLPDLIHGHDPLWGGWIANLLARESECTSVLTVHTSVFARNLASTGERELAERVLNEADVVSAVSESHASSLQNQFGITKPFVLPNVVDEDFLKNARFPRRDEPYTFFSAGSLDGNKNHKLLIDAFARVVSRVPVRLRIAGDGPQRNQLVAQARELGIDAQISFLGVLDKAGMLRELGAADCFALSSRYETFGVVVIEAIAAGLPVVATRCGGPESVISADCGIVVESENVDAMAEAMLLMTESRESFKPEILKQYVARRFGPETYVAQLGILAGTVTSKKNALR